MARSVAADVFSRSQEASMAVRRLLAGRRLIVASNREPYSHVRMRGKVEMRHNAGGLVAALDPVLSAVGGSWVAWGNGDADFVVADEQHRVRISGDSGAYTLRRVHLTDREVDAYYNGFANRVLWPLCHLELGRMAFESEEWDCYQRVNRRFAEAIAKETEQQDAIVWLQDYHLATCARHLAALGVDVSVHLFWHIPFPGPDVLRTLPVRKELLAGMLGCGVLAFHIERYADAFLAGVRAELPDAEIDGDGVFWHGHYTRVAAMPISVDTAALAVRAASPATDDAMMRLVQGLHIRGQRVLLGVDRVDYTKGIPERLEAFARLLQRRPDLLGNITFIQKVDIGRQGIEDYRELTAEIREAVSVINRTYGRPGWQPLHLLQSAMSAQELCALYRLADVMVVSPLRDGMNLVAKEFIACQSLEHPGVLVLSELCGAAEELGSASVMIHPYDPDGFATALEQSLDMDTATRRRRLTRLQEQTAQWDVFDWLSGALSLEGRPRSARG